VFPFWEKVVAPVLEAAEVRRLVEIGALRGEQTQLILDHLGEGCELHVIDPVPDFDPDEHRERFGEGYVFHRALSLDVLGDLPPMDAALVDGDHNWYTVVNELRLLARVARSAREPLPVLVLHDVGWPYGRRDLYYSPDTVPEEHRQPWAQRGIRPGVERLVPVGGLNPTMFNAVREGGPRNGVRTALDDFVAEYDRPLRQVVLPIYFGLAIVVEEERLERQSALRELLDGLETTEGKDMLLRLAEAMRIEAMIFQHRIYFEKEATIEELADRYLDSVKRGLIDEYYLENEVRLAHLADCVTRPRPVELPRLRDPQRHDKEALDRLRHLRRTGQRPESHDPPTGYAYSPGGRLGLDHLHECLDSVREDHVRGDLVSCGEGRGGTGIFLRAYLEAHRLADRDVWMAGRFRAAVDERTVPDVADGLAELRPDLNTIRDGFERFGLADERTHFLQGDLTATLPDAPVPKVALLHLGPELGPAAGGVLTHLYPRLALGGYVVVEDATDEAMAAVDDYRAATGVDEPVRRIGVHGLSWRKTREVDETPTGGEVTHHAGRVPLAVPARSASCDLSVVLVVHDMRREAERTLHALSRNYQQSVEDLDYEVLVVENGSAEDQVLGEEMVRSFGAEFRYLDLADEATPSPANAMNRGIRESVGDVVALMVDGAHLLTPGVLHHAMTGLAAYEPAVVAVQPWYLGPGQQGEAMRAGYDQDYEDALFRKIDWPSDGYALFEIGHFQGDRDWLDGLWESNCLFVPRKLLEQAGGFDEGFDNAGGGFTNLDLYERLAAAPEIRVVSVLGEGSFHQVHGGTTTNQADPDERRARVFSYGERYAELRGRPYTGPEKQIHYVGSFHGDASRRTRARRMTAQAFEVDDFLEGIDGRAQVGKSIPIPDDLRDGFVAAYHRSLAWRDTEWMGRQVQNVPTDLFTYQELVHEVRPDFVIETGTRHGGRALFFAHLFDLLGSGRVVAVDIDRRGVEGPEHPRITYVRGHAHDEEVVAEVADVVGDEPRALVVLGTRGAQRRMHREFEAYARFVPVGSYVVMEHTVLNGYPVDASFGPGPFEALRRILNTRGDFVADTRRDRHGLSFNPGGFLRRTR
jgi:cephalosporin hydroxylase/glycosyltransferase involved in cell wall biosynthesis